MIQSIRVQNFKVMRDSAPVRLARLTLVLGKNSAGKSALIQPLLLLAQSVREASSAHKPLELNGPFVELGDYREIVHRHDLRTRITFELEAAPSSLGLRRARSFSGGRAPEIPEFTDIQYMLTFRYGRSAEAIRIDSVRHRVPALGLGIERRRVRNRVTGEFMERSQPTVSSTLSFPLADSDDILDVEPLQPPREPSAEPDPVDIRRALSIQMAQLWRWEFLALDYIPPVREPGRRYYPTTARRGAEDFSGAAIAGDIRRINRSRSGEAADFLRRWLTRFDIASDITASRLAEGLLAVRMTDATTGVDSSVADFGFGASQLLPLLIYGALYSRKRESTLVLQQPEVHLHAEAQAELADLLIELSGDGSQVIAETHSEHLVRRVQRRVLTGALSPDDVSIVFVEKTAAGGRAHQIILDDGGRVVSEAPPGFLDTAYSEALRFQSASMPGQQ